MIEICWDVAIKINQFCSTNKYLPKSSQAYNRHTWRSANCSISCLNEDKSYWCFMCVYYCLLSALICVLFTSVHAYIYSGNVTYSDISGLLIGYWLHHGGCASCTDSDITLYPQHPPSSNKQKLELICGVNNIIMLKQLMMHMNRLTQLCTYIRLLWWWKLLSWCMCSDYMGCMSVC